MEIPTSSTVILERGRVTARTDFTNSLLRLNAGLWLTFLGISLAVSVPAALRYEKSNTLTVVDGKLALDFEHFITKEHPYRMTSLNGWSALEYTLFKAGKPGLVIGEDGWLFSSEEFPLPSLLAANTGRNLDRMQEVVGRLASKGIRTVILPIPAKADIYGEHVPAALRGHTLGMTTVANALDARRLEWIPLTDSFVAARNQGVPLFFRTETHWTPDGAHLAARTVQAWVHTHGLRQWEGKRFQVRSEAPRPLESDLENYLPLRPMFSKLLPEPETYTPHRVSSAAVATDETALFSDTGNPVALVGTSYSADDRWNFPGWLRLEMGTDLDNIADKGKGPFAPMERFLKLVDEGKTGAKLVIWEMPVRTLAMDLSPRNKNGNH